MSMSFSVLDFPLDVPEISFSENGVTGRRSILPSGVRVLTEHVPGQSSVALGFWVGAGSRDEQKISSGSTHFLEHLLFKGTSTRSALDISRLGDFLGGTLNAATARQYTCYYGRVFSSDLPQLVELLADMLTDSRLDPADMETERGVILEELASSEDDVSEVAQMALLPAVCGDHPLARPVGGTMAEVRALDHQHMIDHYRAVYRPAELVVTAAGAVDHEQLCDLVTQMLSRHWDLTPAAAGGGADSVAAGVARAAHDAAGTAAHSALVTPAPRRRVADIAYTAGSEQIIAHPGKQSDVIIGMPGWRIADPHEYAAVMLGMILGGGTSSRLFQEVREKRGLAYSAYSWQMPWQEGAVFAMEAACAPENAAKVVQVMHECLADIAANGVTEDEVLTAFNQRRAQLAFAAEGNGFRRMRLGSSELLRGQLTSLTEEVARFAAVTPADVQALANELAGQARSVVIAGPQD